MDIRLILCLELLAAFIYIILYKLLYKYDAALFSLNYGSW